MMFAAARAIRQRSLWVYQLAALMAGALVALSLVGLSQYIAGSHRKMADLSREQDLLIHASQVRSRLETLLNSELYSINGLVAYLQAQPQTYDSPTVQHLMERIIVDMPYVRNIGIARGFTMVKVVPPVGNEKAVGLDYRQHPHQWADVALAIKQHSPVLSRPVSLVQGGKGLIYRVPIFLPDGNYWGLASLVLDADRIWAFGGLPGQAHYHYVIEPHPIDAAAAAMPTRINMDGDVEATLSLALPGAQWQLRASADSADLDRAEFWIDMLQQSLSVVGGLMVYFCIRVLGQQFAYQNLLAFSRYTLDHAPESIIWVSPEGTVEYMNECACLWLNQTYPGRLQQPVWRILPNITPESWPQIVQNLRLQQQQRVQMRHELEGPVKFLESTRTLVTFAGREMVVMSARDITEQKQADLDLINLYERLQIAAQAGNIGIWEWNISEQVLTADLILRRLFGLPDDGPLAPNALMRQVHPDDVPSVKANMDLALRGVVPFNAEFRVLHTGDGQEFTVRGMARVQRDSEGVVVRMVGVAWDITEQKRTERALRDGERRWQFALEGSGDGVWDWDMVRGRLEFSPQWWAMLGYAQNEGENSQGEHELRVHPDDLAERNAELARHLDGDTPVYVHEHRVMCGDGRYKWILERGLVIDRNEAGSPTRMIGTHTDIDPRKAAEQRMLDLNERLLRLFDNAPIGAALVSLDGHFLNVNPTLCEILGYTAEALKAHTVESITYFNDIAQTQQHQLALIAGTINSYSQQKRYRHHEGHFVTVQVDVSMVRDAQGTPLYLIKQVQDITARIESEQKLRELNEQLVQVFEKAPIGKALVNLDGQFMQANPMLCDILGYSAQELCGLTLYGLAHIDEQAECYRELERVVTGMDSSYRHQKRYQHADGHCITVQLDVSLVRDAKGWPVYVIAQMQDITARLAAEAALRASQAQLAEAQRLAHLGFWERDLQGNDLVWSAENYRIFGLEGRDSPPSAKERQAMIHPEDREHINFIEAQVTEYSGLFDEQLRIYRPSGEMRYLRTVYHAQLNAKGQVASLFGVTQDITEQKKAEHIKNEFVSIVSHELRTPLTAIRGSLGLVNGIYATQVPVPVKNMLDVASRNTERLLALINDLLDMEKISAGKMEIILERQPLMPIIDQTLEAIIPYALQLGVRVSLQSQMECHVLVDKGRLQQVLSNLLSNAAKFTASAELPAERHAVEIDVKPQSAEQVRISVTDHGIGIPKNVHHRLFQKFSQVDSSDSRAKGGTGLGLAISRALIERMDGVVGFDSEPGVGSVFWVDLPLN